MDDGGLHRRIEAVRAFSRFYTRRIGVLEEGLLRTPFSLTEARVLYELGHRDDLTAAALSAELGLDPGYLSRILRGFQDRGLIARAPSPADARQHLLSLTQTGRSAFAALNAASHHDIAAMLCALPDHRQRKLVEAMAAIRDVLDAPPQRQSPCLLRPHRPGDIGWVVHRHGVLYQREYGWDATFEALAAEVVADFVRNFDPGRERCWIAEREGENVGAVFLVGDRSEKDLARLRLLLVEPQARGLGIGRRLVQECARFARGAGYRRIALWTNSVLGAARHIYRREGYQLVASEPHRSFGHDLIGETWVLDL